MCTAPVRKPSAKVVEVRNYLLQNLQYPCSVSLLADKVEMSKRKLEKKFSQYTGTTIYNFLIQERMKKAETLLRNTEMPVKEIAAAVGYKKPSNFTEAFKKKYGYLPSLLRQRYISLDQPKLPDIA
jgi:transcriptional regulator GlxA family with amidase domain